MWKKKIIQLSFHPSNATAHFHFANESIQNLGTKTVTNAVKRVLSLI